MLKARELAGLWKTMKIGGIMKQIPKNSDFPDFPPICLRFWHFVTVFERWLKKIGISWSIDDSIFVKYIVFASICVVIHISTISGSEVLEFLKIVIIFRKSGQNRGKSG